jgi:hypothetical protein
VDSHRGRPGTKEPPHTHDSPACTHPGDKGIGLHPPHSHLIPDLRTGGGLVGLHVGKVRELMGKENRVLPFRHLIRPGDTPQEPPFFVTHGHNGGPEAPDQVHPFPTHPIGHEDGDSVSQGPADGGEGDSSIPAGGLGNRVASPDGPVLIRPPKNVEGHPVLDASGEIRLLPLGVHCALPTLEEAPNGQEGSVTHGPGQLGEGLSDHRSVNVSHGIPKVGGERERADGKMVGIHTATQHMAGQGETAQFPSPRVPAALCLFPSGAEIFRHHYFSFLNPK